MFYLELYGVFITFLLFCLLHMLYKWTGVKLFTPFCAVNESIWEHLKIGFFSIFFYGLFEHFNLLSLNENFLFAKATALLAMPLFITIIYYSYTAITHKSILWVDILIAFLACAFSQWVSYSLLCNEKDFSKYNYASAFFISMMIFMFVVFTYYPPKFAIFKDNSPKNK